MEKITYNLLTTIKDTIIWATNRTPSMYYSEKNYVIVYWRIRSTQDSIYEMFNSKDDMEFYYSDIKYSFEMYYPNLCLDVKYNYGPVELDNILYSQIIYYYYDMSYNNSNIYFVS